MPSYARHTGPSNRGEATLLAGETTVTITHGLVYQPRIVLCNTGANIGITWVRDINRMTFDFVCPAAAGQNVAVYWYVE